MEDHFLPFREGIIGIDKVISTPYGNKKIVYADWTASGRSYLPIEKRIQENFLPVLGNTHTETSSTGMAMTYAYHKAQKIIKKHVNAGPRDIIITSNSGMTGVINKFQRILGLKVHENYSTSIRAGIENKPIIFITHMEHHSNQTSWLETIADVEIIRPTEDGLVDLAHFQQLIDQYRSREIKIAAVTSCSNVTGIMTPYYEIAKMIHKAGGHCFVDFACSAPYVDIDMHPGEEGSHLDAVYFSPHKFLGGPGSSGVLIFNADLYHNSVPDNPGGGTVYWTNPWGDHKYIDDIEAREDGGTPGFLQAIRAAMSMKLKEEMGVENILKREHELLDIIWEKLQGIENLHILAGQHKDRLGVISFYIDDLHYNLGVKILNDRFGIQSRGGCSCAGTYGHYLLNVDKEQSRSITDKINLGDLSSKPGWIRVSLHPTMTNEEVHFLADSLIELAENFQNWANDYEIDLINGTFSPKINQADKNLKSHIEKCLTEGFINTNIPEKLFRMV